ncbi:MAG: hypothetical protein AAGK32_16515, partial [Actinomycetota bacterium]
MEAVHPHRFVVAVVGLVALLAGALGVLRAGAEGAGEDLPELPAVDERFEIDRHRVRRVQKDQVCALDFQQCALCV